MTYQEKVAAAIEEYRVERRKETEAQAEYTKAKEDRDAAQARLEDARCRLPHTDEGAFLLLWNLGKLLAAGDQEAE